MRVFVHPFRFIGFKPHQTYLRQRESWLYILLAKILDADDTIEKPWLNLLDKSAADFLGSAYEASPRYAKVDMWHYDMAQPLWRIVPRWVSGQGVVVWWNRTFEESLIPPVELDVTTKRLQLAKGN